jgi:hypothetical protein
MSFHVVFMVGNVVVVKPVRFGVERNLFRDLKISCRVFAKFSCGVALVDIR